MEKIKSFSKEYCVVIVTAVALAVYYALGMFTNKPWYDELYTYYYFISRGPAYAAVHWPVPNNHIGYSVISAFFDYLGNPYIGLRGVSVIASVANVVLIFGLAKRLMDKTAGYVAMLMYASVNLVNTLAIQGRGYSLATTCFIVAALCVLRIVSGEDKERLYIIWIIAMALGLYILPSSSYWVLAVCFCGGAYTLFNKQYKTMWKLIGHAVIAAVITAGLYAIVWLAIGSNLLKKAVDSAYANMGHVKIILSHPFAAAKAGIEYMLATPYIQSTDRAIVVKELGAYSRDLFELYIPGCGTIIICLLCFVTIFSVFLIYKGKKEEDDKTFLLGIFMLIQNVMYPLVLVVQSVQPYKRVFSYFGVVFALCVALLIYLSKEQLNQERIKKLFSVEIVLVCAVATVILLGSKNYNAPLADRENRLWQLFEQMDVTDIDTCYFTDDYQKYVLKFYYDYEPEEVGLDEANYLVISDEYEKYIEIPDWPLMLCSDDLKLDEIKANYEVVLQDGGYTVYRRIVVK